MRKLLVVLGAIFLAACGGGGDNSSTTQTTIPAGIYSGTITPSGGAPDVAIAIITSNGQASIMDVDSIEAFLGTVSGTAITGAIYSNSTVPATVLVTSINGDNIGGTYSSTLGGGTFAVTADPILYSRTASLSKLTGVWVDSVFTNVTGITTWVVQADGLFSVSSTSGCAGEGSFSVINPLNNEYNLTLTVTNCQSYNGTYSGIAVLSDTNFTDDTISLVFGNGASGGIFEPIKQ